MTQTSGVQHIYKLYRTLVTDDVRKSRVTVVSYEVVQDNGEERWKERASATHLVVDKIPDCDLSLFPNVSTVASHPPQQVLVPVIFLINVQLPYVGTVHMIPKLEAVSCSGGCVSRAIDLSGIVHIPASGFDVHVET